MTDNSLIYIWVFTVYMFNFVIFSKNWEILSFMFNFVIFSITRIYGKYGFNNWNSAHLHLYILDTSLFSVEQKYFIDANSSVGYTTSTDIQTQNIPILNCLTNFMTWNKLGCPGLTTIYHFLMAFRVGWSPQAGF